MSIIVRALAAAFLLWGLQRHGYDYYTLLRWVTCFAAAYSAYVALLARKTAWVWVLMAVALLFNPIVPVHLKRDVWQPIDTGTALLLLVSIAAVREKRSPGS